MRSDRRGLAHLPVTPAGGGPRRDVPRQHGARLAAAHAPRVAELLARGEQLPAAPAEVVRRGAVEVAAEAAHEAAHLGRHRQLQEAHPVPQQAGSCTQH